MNSFLKITFQSLQYSPLKCQAKIISLLNSAVGYDMCQIKISVPKSRIYTNILTNYLLTILIQFKGYYYYFVIL